MGGLCWEDKAHIQAVWHFLHDLGFSVSFCAASLLLLQRKWLWGPLPPVFLLCFSLEHTSVHSPLLLAAFSCILRAGCLLTPSFNENGLHTFDLLVHFICAQLQGKKKRRDDFHAPSSNQLAILLEQSVARSSAEWPALCSDIASCHKMQEMTSST